MKRLWPLLLFAIINLYSCEQEETIVSITDHHIEISNDGGIVEIRYATNVKCDIIIPTEALSWISIDDTRALDEKSQRLLISPNASEHSRKAIVTVMARDNINILEEYTIEQEGVDTPYINVDTSRIILDGEDASFNIKVSCNSDWEVEIKDDGWLIVTPMKGSGNGSISLSAFYNDSGYERQTTIQIYARHKFYGRWDSRKITIIQDVPYTDDSTLYYDNFDGEIATKTFGMGNSWPKIDEFPEFANAKGSGSQNVTYSGTDVSIRSNSSSDGTYSDYEGSGKNNIFFHNNGLLIVNNIKLDSSQAKNYILTFGAEKYNQYQNSRFNPSEFNVFLSKDGESWVKLNYNFMGTEDGQWNIAKAVFTLDTVPNNLYIKFAANLGNAYRIDDVKLSRYVESGTNIEL